MRINVYRLRIWYKGQKELFRDLDFEFKDSNYYRLKSWLRTEGYRVQELFAWS